MSAHVAVSTQLLIEAREFLADPERWCQRDLALDAAGRPVAGGNLQLATKCCGLGAIALAGWKRGMDTLDPDLVAASGALERVVSGLYPQATGQQSLAPGAWVNDHIGYSAILACFDLAIAEALR